MRAFVAAFIAFLCLVAPAYAQKPQAPDRNAPSVSFDAPPPSASEAAAARDMMTAFVLESGALDAALEHAIAQELPNLRALANDPALARELGPEAQARVRAYLESLPGIVRDEIQLAIPRAVDMCVPALAEMFTEEEMLGIAEFFRDEQTGDLLRRMVRNPSDISQRDMRLMERFVGTEPGRAFVMHGDAMFDLLGRAFQEVTPQILAGLERRVLGGMCDAFGDQCPQDLRERAGTI